MTSTAPVLTLAGSTDPGGLLAGVRADRALIEAAEVRQLARAVAWALAHPPAEPGDEAAFLTPGSEHVEPIAGAGCPAVGEFCLAELGAVLGMSTIVAKHYVGQCLEIAFRLPQLHARVTTGAVAVWRARQVAERTIHADLSPEAAAYVDRACAPFVGRMSAAAVDRLVEAAIARFHPDRAAREATSGADGRHVTIEDQHVSFAGTMRVEAELDLADALDLRDAVAHGAEALRLLGSDLPVDARRAKAVGDLARTQLALDLAVGPAPVGTHGNDPDDHRRPEEVDRDREPAVGGLRVKPSREVVIHAHVATTATGELSPFARVEGQGNVLVDQIATWVRDTRTKVTLRPVVDLAADLIAPGYVVPERVREQVVLRDVTCVFPWCGVSARRCDLDHVVPYCHACADRPPGRPPAPCPLDPGGGTRCLGGRTRSLNLAALCRRHHRLKTFAPWSYEQAAPGVFVWTSPHGQRYLRDRTGTETLPPDP